MKTLVLFLLLGLALCSFGYKLEKEVNYGKDESDTADDDNDEAQMDSALVEQDDDKGLESQDEDEDENEVDDAKRKPRYRRWRCRLRRFRRLRRLPRIFRCLDARCCKRECKAKPTRSEKRKCFRQCFRKRRRNRKNNRTSFRSAIQCMRGCNSQFPGRGNRTERINCKKPCVDSYCTNTTSSNATVTVSDMTQNYHEDVEMDNTFSTEENNGKNLPSSDNLSFSHNLPSSDEKETEVEDSSIENTRPDDDDAVADDGIEEDDF